MCSGAQKLSKTEFDRFRGAKNKYFTFNDTLENTPFGRAQARRQPRFANCPSLPEFPRPSLLGHPPFHPSADAVRCLGAEGRIGSPTVRLPDRLDYDGKYSSKSVNARIPRAPDERKMAGPVYLYKQRKFGLILSRCRLSP